LFSKRFAQVFYSIGTTITISIFLHYNISTAKTNAAAITPAVDIRIETAPSFGVDVGSGSTAVTLWPADAAAEALFVAVARGPNLDGKPGLVCVTDANGTISHPVSPADFLLNNHLV
jgi:hypothetical protein